MTREEIMNLDMEALEERSKAIAEETREADIEKLEELNMELDNIEQRKNEIKAAAEETREAMLEVLEGAGETVEEVKEERKAMTNVEIRKSPEYLTAWVSDALGHANAEQRALLTENATNGTVAVPAYVDDAIQTAWESNELLRRIRRTYYPGNLKVGYEVAAPYAVAHTEGGEAVTEEELQLGIVTLIPKMIKKWVSYSDEAGDINENFARYIVDEVTDRVIKGVIKELLATVVDPAGLAVIDGSPGTSVTTADLISAVGTLMGVVDDPVVIITRSAAAALKTVALNASYSYDPFDGMDVIYVDQAAMPIDTSEGGGPVQAIVADLSAFQVNFPAGDDVKIKVDDLTAAASDMVKVYGRVYAAVGITKPAAVVGLLGGMQ